MVPLLYTHGRCTCWTPGFCQSGPINSCLSACPSNYASVRNQYCMEYAHLVFKKNMAQWYLIRILKMVKTEFWVKFCSPKNWQNESRWKVLLFFPGNNLKWIIIWLFIFHCKPLSSKSLAPMLEAKCCRPRSYFFKFLIFLSFLQVDLLQAHQGHDQTKPKYPK